MTTLRPPILPIAGLMLVIAAFTSLLALLTSSRTDPLVACSNTASVYDVLAEHYEQHVRISIDVVRVPTPEALSHLAATRGDFEFDVWLGGPAETRAEAGCLGLLRPVESIDVSGLPEHYHSASWFGFYGGSSRSA